MAFLQWTQQDRECFVWLFRRSRPKHIVIMNDTGVRICYNAPVRSLAGRPSTVVSRVVAAVNGVVLVGAVPTKRHTPKEPAPITTYIKARVLSVDTRRISC
jgi:hypothetical protein